MRIGQLRHRVRLQSPAGSRDSVGERITVWIDVAVIWAQVEPLSGGDVFLAAQRQASTSHKVTLRFSSTTSPVTGAWRVLYDRRILVVDNVINVEERNEWLELFCTEGLAAE